MSSINNDSAEPATVQAPEANDDDEHWNFMIQGLVEFKKMMGHLIVPQGCDYFGVSLYDWVIEQRRTNDHEPTRLERLRSLGFELQPVSRTKKKKRKKATPVFRTQQDRNKWFDDYWSVLLEGLIELHRATGDWNVPIDYMYQGNNLYNWACTQRSLFR